MDLVIALTLEYIFDERECVSYLTSINIDPVEYDNIYYEYTYVK
jgi:hypothetical protein